MPLVSDVFLALVISKNVTDFRLNCVYLFYFYCSWGTVVNHLKSFIMVHNNVQYNVYYFVNHCEREKLKKKTELKNMNYVLYL